MDSAPKQERYEIRSKLGQGGIGAVYRAFDRALKREVAVKRLLPQGDKPEEERHSTEELVREAGMLSQLQHPNIVTVYDAGIDEDGGFVIMELIDGETIDRTVERGALTYDDFKEVVEQSLEGLLAAQEIGMLHRDIKPSNVMVRWHPSGRFEVKLLDFGLAKVTQKPILQTIQHGDAILGSIYFMAPEQFEREPLDGRVDLYALGSLFYYALAGGYPFDGDTGAAVMVKKLEHEIEPIGKLRPDIPAPVADWVMRMMARYRDHRPDDARQALEEFHAADALAGEAIPAAPQFTPATPPTALVHTPGTTPVTARAPLPTTGTAPVQAAPVTTMLSPATGTVPVPNQATGPVGAPGQQTTSYFMVPPQGSNKKQIVVTAAVTFAVLAAIAGAAFYLFSQKKDKPADEPDYQDYYEAETEEPRPPSSKATPLIAVIPMKSEWKFWDRGKPPQKWRSADFDDSDWGRGKAPLGYGEKNGITTELGFGDDSDNKFISSYFRRSFTLPGAVPQAAELSFQVDDGCAIYINGKRVALKHLPDKPEIRPDELATVTADAKQEAKIHHNTVDPSVLRPGKNIIAAQVHQARPDSSDIRFALELRLGEGAP